MRRIVMTFAVVLWMVSFTPRPAMAACAYDPAHPSAPCCDGGLDAGCTYGGESVPAQSLENDQSFEPAWDWSLLGPAARNALGVLVVTGLAVVAWRVDRAPGRGVRKHGAEDVSPDETWR